MTPLTDPELAALAELAERAQREIDNMTLSARPALSDFRVAASPSTIKRLLSSHATLRESLHYANGVADLAMKHRDAAEAEAATLRAANEELAKALIAANGLLRSAYQVATRSGYQTNWGAFEGQLKAELEREHRILHSPEAGKGDAGIERVSTQRGEP